jgi:UDPglucose--hexose-1-phosphate uridylyltransferase
MMGASNAHPHGQIWATSSVPNELAREDARQRDWLDAHAEPLLLAYLRRELADGERILLTNDAFVALVPFWAAWPFETLILPRAQVSGFDDLSESERRDLADMLARLTAGYDALFSAPFPYTMGFHQRPTDGRMSDHFTLHAHFYPPLLRSASIRKFMVGFEMLGMPQRDLTPEAAADRLRAVL